jgi:fructuronate reductase
VGLVIVRRLHPAALGQLPPDVERPRYDRAALRAGIVHLGVGAFQRAHLAVITEAALHATCDMRWGIVGVSLRQSDTRDALKPQDFLYAVAIRDATEDGSPREALQVIGNLIDVLVAPEDPTAVLDRIANVDTRIVSLTVTEKGYCYNPVTRDLRFDHPDIAHDLAQKATPRTAVGMLVRGLQCRRASGLGPVTLMSLDNLPANGHTLKGLVLSFAGRVDPELSVWIEASCTFPNSMVDRIVPRTLDADRERIAARLGVQDAWPVLGEPFFDWAVEDSFAAGRPDWAIGGARFVARTEPYEQLKLRMVNGTHSALAYLGAMAGFDTVDRAIAQPWLHSYIATLMREEIAPTLPPLLGMDFEQYAARLLLRFANPALQHQTRQIAMDGSQKLPQRLFGTIADQLETDSSIDHLALAVAAWLHYLRGIDESGQPYEIVDPLACALADAIAQADVACAAAVDSQAAERRRVEVFARRTGLFGELVDKPRFIEAVASHTHALRERGVRAAVQACR